MCFTRHTTLQILPHNNNNKKEEKKTLWGQLLSMDYSILYSHNSRGNHFHKNVHYEAELSPYINKLYVCVLELTEVKRKMLHEVLYCGYAKISRVHCALGCVHILLTLLGFVLCALGSPPV